jgi:hypothetical protein
MKTRMTATITVLFALAVGLAAQNRPDFSGTWVPIDSAPSPAPPPPPPLPDGPPPPPPPPRTLSVSVTQSPTEMKVERRVEASGRDEVYTFIYRLDGGESVNRMGVLVFRTNASWDGASLVVSSVVTTDGNALGTMKEVYRLENGTLVVDSTRMSPAGVFTSRTIHKRNDAARLQPRDRQTAVHVNDRPGRIR